MTTEGAVGFARAASVALLTWFAGLALITPALEPTRDVLIFGPNRVIDALPAAGAALVESASSWTKVRRVEAGFVRRLYGNGAWLVLPAFDGGCNRPARPQPSPSARA